MPERVITTADTTKIYDTFGVDINNHMSIGTIKYLFNAADATFSISFDASDSETCFYDVEGNPLDFATNDIKLNRIVICNQGVDALGVKIDSPTGNPGGVGSGPFYNFVLLKYGALQLGMFDPKITVSLTALDSAGEVTVTGFF